ncbi:hypothetical protein H2199_004124 [Coniosporium tulheliwenetii]|uniref:Uncharacterized protein n=1 Tax=Coniosporium tulheliwenetii TaxID=3383036 RepID=A0ACC2Z8M1_9PEZI|nr:hypothetical protein H2199_004124 [Cladosporium sp. JES 115]
MAATGSGMDRSLRRIFKRCVECPLVNPSCPVCPSGQVCSQIAESCDSCARTECVPISLSTSPNGEKNQNSGPNVGAIAGGVIGGIVFVAILTWLIWKFWIKRRRDEYEYGDWNDADAPVEKGGDDFTKRRDARASTHTVASLASTIATRASNVIQIAFIPGVTTRDGPASPDLLVPPVPPIPSAMGSPSIHGSPYSTEDQHFFVPGDLRGSTYSGLTDGSDARSSYRHLSLTPSLARNSVASTVYRNNAVVDPMPAQTVVRGKAAVVSVKSSQSNSPVGTPGAETPPVPSIDYSKFTSKGPSRVQIPHSLASSARSTPHGSIRSVQTVGKPKALTIIKREKAPVRMTSSDTLQSQNTIISFETADSSPSVPIGLAPSSSRPLTHVSEASTSSAGTAHRRARQSDNLLDDSDSDGEGDHDRARMSLLGRDSQITEIADTPALPISPFMDAGRQGGWRLWRRRRIGVGGGGSRGRARSPFGDEHAVEQ